MYPLVRPFVQLCFFRFGPQDLPQSTLLLGVVLLVHAITSMLVSSVLFPPGDAMLAGLSSSLLLVALTCSVLTVQGLNTRLVQTLTAICGADALLNLAGFPLVQWFESVRQSQLEQGTPALVILVFIGWSLCIHGNILRLALTIPFFLGLLLALAFHLLSQTILGVLFPIPP